MNIQSSSAWSVLNLTAPESRDLVRSNFLTGDENPMKQSD